MNIIAFDLSLTCTGWALAVVRGTNVGTIIPPKGCVGIPRLRWIRDAVLDGAAGADLVVLEGYSFASRGRAIISLGELGGVVRCALADAGLVSVEVPPACRALFATGKGNASKEQVLAEAIRKLDYAGHSNDEADALWLLAMARFRYEGFAPVTAARQKAIAKVDWPALTLAGLTTEPSA